VDRWCIVRKIEKCSSGSCGSMEKKKKRIHTGVACLGPVRQTAETPRRRCPTWLDQLALHGGLQWLLSVDSGSKALQQAASKTPGPGPGALEVARGAKG
jgi:hypothetical protein